MSQVGGLPRVAFIAGTLGRGGAERQLYYQVKALVSAGATPVVVSLSSEEHWDEPIRQLGAEVISLGAHQSPIVRVQLLVSKLRKHGPQVIQSAHFFTNLYACAAARVLRTAEVGAIRSDAQWAVNALGRAGPISLRAPRHLAVNSRAALAQAAALGASPSRLSYLPNVVDTVAFGPGTKRSRSLNLLDVGRLDEQKRHDRFLRVVRRAVDEVAGVDIRATIVGEGPVRTQLERMARELGIEERVTFLVDPPMEDVYRDASILLLTSEKEGTPNVVLEAMAAEVPVVAFGIGGVPEIILSDRVGLLIRPGDEEALARATVELCADHERRARIGAEARRFVDETRSPAALVSHLRNLYRRAAVQRGGTPPRWAANRRKPQGSYTRADRSRGD